MPKLRHYVLPHDRAQRQAVFRDCQNLLDAEVGNKRGMSGATVKLGYKVVKAFKPNFIEKVLRDLVPQFCDALDPLHEEYLAGGSEGRFGDRLRKNKPDVAERLLSVTDDKARRSTNKVVTKWYGKLRGKAKSHVAEAVPGLARVLDKHYATPEPRDPSDEATPATDTTSKET